MARKTKSTAKRRKRVLWTPADLKLLRSEAGKTPLKTLARKLKRTPAAVQFRAVMLKISTRQKKKK